MAGKLEKVSFTGLEVQEASAEMAARSVALNGLEERIKIVHGDLCDAESLFPRHSFNVVTCNPPYMIDEHGRGNALDAKKIARHEVLCTLEDVVAAADSLLATHGRFFMIHRPFRLPEIFSALEKHNIEMKRMRLIQPFADKEPNMVLIEARKNAKRRLTIEPPLIVRYDDGEYTEEIQNIYNK
jgi:tRNA1Val (adenine37-N6)-methyltransferase